MNHRNLNNSSHQKQHSWTERVKRTTEKLRPQASSLIPAQIKPFFCEVYPPIVPASALCVEMTHKEILFLNVRHLPKQTDNRHWRSWCLWHKCTKLYKHQHNVKTRSFIGFLFTSPLIPHFIPSRFLVPLFFILYFIKSPTHPSPSLQLQ